MCRATGPPIVEGMLDALLRRWTSIWDVLYTGTAAIAGITYGSELKVVTV
jgi:hypothetical protein